MGTNHRLAYHITAETGWINDPNGLVFYNGQYHVFFQHHPYSAQWGPMHWGHVYSTDLVHWKRLPIAIAPDSLADKDGCFSGSAVDDNGVLTLVYTGNRDGISPKQVQCVARSYDGISFSKEATNPVISNPPSDGTEDFRDPKVWRYQDRWYMVVGSGRDGIGKALLYRSSDLVDWEYVGVSTFSDGAQGGMWECPDMFALDGKHVLMFSPMGSEGHKTVYIVGTLDYETGVFTQERWSEIDMGPDFYAPQTFNDNQGRRIMIGWMDMWGRYMPTQAEGWAGSLTIPRQLHLDSNMKLRQEPVQELVSLRQRHWTKENIDNVVGDKLEIRITLSGRHNTSGEGDKASTAGLALRCSPDGENKTLVYCDMTSSELIVDTRMSGQGDGSLIKVPMSNSTSCLQEIVIYVDRSSIEVFADQGLIAISSRIYPSEASVGLSLWQNGTVTQDRGYIDGCDVWELEDIW